MSDEDDSISWTPLERILMQGAEEISDKEIEVVAKTPENVLTRTLEALQEEARTQADRMLSVDSPRFQEICARFTGEPIKKDRSTFLDLMTNRQSMRK